MAAWRVLGLAAALVLTTSPAWAHHDEESHAPKRAGHEAPEIDPSALGSAAALAAGGTALIAAGRSRRRPASRE